MSKELEDLEREWRAKSQAHSSKFAVAKAISGLYDLGLTGTLIPHNWRNWLRRGNRCDIIACDVLALLCYLHRTFTDDYDRERTREDLKTDGYHVTVTYLAEKLQHSEDQIRDALQRLSVENMIMTVKEGSRKGKLCKVIELHPEAIFALSRTKAPDDMTQPQRRPRTGGRVSKSYAEKLAEKAVEGDEER